MNKTAAGVLILFALVVSGSCAKYKISHLPKKEWIVVAVGADAGVCKVTEQRPGEIRTESSGKINWIFVGNCPGNPTISIGSFTHKGGTVQLSDLFKDKDKLSGTLPPPDGEGSTLRLQGTLKDNLQKAHYKYTIMIDGKDAQFRSSADPGDMYACPVWPCGDFKEN